MIHIEEDQPDHVFRTEIPNCVFEAKLDPYTFLVYSHLKKIAGDKGKCWKSLKNLSHDMNISIRQLQKSLKMLEDGQNDLNLKLIKRIERKKEDGSSDTSIIMIINIWRFNGDFYRNKRNIGGAQCAGGVVHNMQEGGAQYANKEDPHEEEPKEQQQKPADAGVVVSSFFEKDIKQFVDLSQAQSRPLTDSFFRKLSKTYSTHEIYVALEAMRLAKEVNEPAKWITAALKEGWKPAPKEARLTIREKVEQKFKKYNEYNGAEFFIDNEGVGFQRGMHQEQLSWKEPGFKDKFNKMLANFKIKNEI